LLFHSVVLPSAVFSLAGNLDRALAIFHSS
jgi:hypothetical protein